MFNNIELGDRAGVCRYGFIQIWGSSSARNYHGAFFFFANFATLRLSRSQMVCLLSLKMYFVSISTADLFETSIDVDHNKW